MSTTSSSPNFLVMLRIGSDMRIKMSLFVSGLYRLSSKERKATMLIGHMDIVRLMIHVQQVEEDIER